MCSCQGKCSGGHASDGYGTSIVGLPTQPEFYSMQIGDISRAICASSGDSAALESAISGFIRLVLESALSDVGHSLEVEIP